MAFNVSEILEGVLEPVGLRMNSLRKWESG